MKKISIIIPMMNESAGIDMLFTRLLPILNQLTITYEIIVINDGSVDDTLAKLREKQKTIAQLKVIDLSRNFGKESALYAGFVYCTGDCAITIDADLQDPPELIHDMLEYWQNGHEVVRAVRSSRNTDTFMKNKTSSFFYKLMTKISDIKLTYNAGDCILLSKPALTAFLMLKEKVRYNKGLLSWIGFDEKIIYYERESRAVGNSKWNYYKLFIFSMDAITSFSKTPLEIWTYLGTLIAFSGFAYGLFYMVKTLLFGIEVHGYPSLLIFILFFSGLQMIGIGILGNYIGRIFIETKERPLYIVRNVYTETI